MASKDTSDFVCSLCDGVITIYHHKSKLMYKGYFSSLKECTTHAITSCSFNPEGDTLRVDFKNHDYVMVPTVSYYDFEAKRRKLVDEFDTQWSIVKWFTRLQHIIALEHLEKERKESKAIEAKRIADYVATLPKTEVQLQTEEVVRLRKEKYELAVKYSNLLRIKRQREEIEELRKQCVEIEENIKTIA